MAWCQTGNKPLTEPIAIQITDNDTYCEVTTVSPLLKKWYLQTNKNTQFGKWNSTPTLGITCHLACGHHALLLVASIRWSRLVWSNIKELTHHFTWWKQNQYTNAWLIITITVDIKVTWQQYRVVYTFHNKCIANDANVHPLSYWWVLWSHTSKQLPHERQEQVLYTDQYRSYIHTDSVQNIP